MHRDHAHKTCARVNTHFNISTRIIIIFPSNSFRIDAVLERG